MRQSARQAGKRRGAAFVPNPVVHGGQEYYGGEEDNEPGGETIIGEPVADATSQCANVLASFTAAEWRETQATNPCLGRVIELKQQWGEHADEANKTIKAVTRKLRRLADCEGARGGSYLRRGPSGARV